MAPSSKSKPAYTAATGLNYTPVGASEEIRVEAGEPAPAVPKDTLEAWCSQGIIVPDNEAARVESVKHTTTVLQREAQARMDRAAFEAEDLIRRRMEHEASLEKRAEARLAARAARNAAENTPVAASDTPPTEDDAA